MQYDNLQKFNLPVPEAVFDLDFYRDQPEPFTKLAQEMWPGLEHMPTLTHSFVAMLADKGILLRNYSQNIDGLEFLADTPVEQLVECHGHYRTAACIDCGMAADMDSVRESIVDNGKPPRCRVCDGLVKPDIVFFGENLPSRFHQLLPKDKRDADLVLVLGTSLQVAPVSMIPDMVTSSCKRVLINRELVGCFEYSCEEGEKLSLNEAKSRRDLFLPGNCDDTIQQIAKALGWIEELEERHQCVVNKMREEKKKRSNK